jgi:hypothetical protein
VWRGFEVLKCTNHRKFLTRQLFMVIILEFMDVLLTELHRNGDGMRLRSVNMLSECGHQLICSQDF